MDYIPLPLCQLGRVYSLHSRNLAIGVYDGANGFIGIREKFGDRYLFTERHYDEGAPFGTVRPIREIAILPADIEPSERISHQFGEVNQWGQLDHWGRRGEEIVPVIRRDKREDEPAHGGRQGFVDLWADTGERLGDAEWPSIRFNGALFDFLVSLEKSA